MTGLFGTLQKSVVSLSDASTNKSLQVAEDPPCLQSLLNGEHERLALIHVLPACHYSQHAITELVYLVKAHHHLNPIFISKHNGPWRIDDGVVMLVLEARGILLSNKNLLVFRWEVVQVTLKREAKFVIQVAEDPSRLQAYHEIPIFYPREMQKRHL
nr:hypothetical protein [Tanacetum cinerariifolium]